MFTLKLTIKLNKVEYFQGFLEISVVLYGNTGECDVLTGDEPNTF